MVASTLSKFLRENGIRAVPHGFRSSFRDWAAELSDAPREVAELALAHIEGSATERAYRRTDLFERRRELMQAWADYLTVNRLPPSLTSGPLLRHFYLVTRLKSKALGTTKFPNPVERLTRTEGFFSFTVVFYG